MKGDFTRNTFDRRKHFTRVLMQQGRVQLDADWNEQAAILLHYMQTLAADMIGPHAGPTDNCGFSVITAKEIDAKDANHNPVLKDLDGSLLSTGKLKSMKDSLPKNGFLIGIGHYYVNGLLCENDDYLGFVDQPGYPFAQSTTLDDLKNSKDSFLVFLDVWERYLSYLEDDSIREKALGGPDTATRAQVVWQVAASELPDAQALLKTLVAERKKTPPDVQKISAAEEKLRKLAEEQCKQLVVLSDARLRARLEPSVQSDDPCIIAPNSGYRGPANQLYRVEIHKGGEAKEATFKWSRDNGSIATAWLRDEGNDLIVGSGRGFAAEQWVELTHDALELGGEPGTLVKLVNVTAEALTIDPASRNGTIPWRPAYMNPKVRRWDHRATIGTEGAVPIQEVTKKADWIELEDGLQIQFQPGATYRTGDYWLIPARTATGNIEWPIDADGISPQGIEHHYAPLAVIEIDNSSNLTNLVDCRRVIKNIVQ
jgi:uncharacterized protein DUF6519